MSWKNLFLWAALFSLISTLTAHASMRMACYGQGNGVEDYAVIFRGQVTQDANLQFDRSGAKGDLKAPVYTTTLDVQEVYKGEVAGSVKIFQTGYSYSGYKKFTAGEVVTIFAMRNGQDKTLVINAECSPVIRTEKEGYNNYERQSELLQALGKKIKVMDSELSKNPRKDLYLQKITLLEKFHDYERLKSTFAAALSLPADAGTASLKSDECTGASEWKEGMPQFLKTSTADKADMLTAYGRTLFRLQEYEAALRPLCMAEALSNSPEPRQWITQILQKQGKIDDSNPDKIDFAQATLTDQVFEGKKFRGVSFKGAHLNKVKFLNSDLSGADFTDAEMSVEIRGSDFGGAKFDGSKVKGAILDSKFDNASFIKANFDLQMAGGNSFKKADFSSATMILMECRSIKDWQGNDFGDARFTDATISGLQKSNTKGADFTRTNFFTKRCTPQNQGLDLSGKQLENTKFDFGTYAGGTFRGSNLRNSTFTGDDLTNVDFSEADLTGADFTNSSYNGPAKLMGANFSTAKIDAVKWAGALFDCSTKFPPGFKPEEHLMVTKDRSCASGATKNPGVVNYDQELLGKGYMNVCNGDFHADCIYGFLASYHVKQKNWGYKKEYLRLAESFLDAGYPNMARVIALKMMGGIALSKRDLDPKDFSDLLPIMERIDRLNNKSGIKKNVAEPINLSRFLKRDDRESGHALAEAAQERADAGDLAAALAYAKAIGSEEYNREVLSWRDDARRVNEDYGRGQQHVAVMMTLALEQQRHGQNAIPVINGLIESLQAKPKGRDQEMLAAAAMLAGMNSARPDLLAAAYAATERVEEAWKIYRAMQAGNSPSRKMSVLSAIASHYAEHDDKSGKAKVADELKVFAIERWPQQGDMITIGIEIGIHKNIFDVLGDLKSIPAIEQIVSITESYSNEDLKTRARLYAAEAFAKAGNIEKAFASFERCRQAITEAAPPIQRRQTPQFVIMLAPSGSQTVKTANIMLQDKEFGNFIMAVAVSSATKDEKLKVLKAGSDLLASGKAGSPVFRAQLAVATAAVLKDAESGKKMEDAEYGVPPSVFAFLLHQAGFHVAEKQLIKVSWASADSPPAIGLERLGFRTGYQSWRNGGQMALLAAMLARDGEFEEAIRLSASMSDPSAVQKIGGTDYATYFAQQKALYNVALGALRKGEHDTSAKIAKESITYQPYKAGVYFALAKASLADKVKAKKVYDAGYEMVPTFGSAMGAPFLDPDGLALEVLIDRAAAETGLGLADRYNQTLSYAKLAASMAENDIQRGKTSFTVDQIAQLENGTANAPKQTVEDLIKSLGIQDDLNSTSVVAEMAEKYLREGDEPRARAIALYGFRNIDNYPQAHGKVTVLLPYASTIARTEPRMSEDAQKKLEAILREVHPNTPGGKVDPSAQNTDLVAQGELAYQGLQRRIALYYSPQNETKVIPAVPAPTPSINIPSPVSPTQQGGQIFWDTQGADTRFIITDKSLYDGSDTRIFKVRNYRDYSVALSHLAVTDEGGTQLKTWAVLSSSTCLKGTGAADPDCTVIVQAKPDMDGQISGFLSLYGRPDKRSPKTLMLSGYARGIAGKLPQKVDGNGDRCPTAGQPAEVAVSATGGFHTEGYFRPKWGSSDKMYELVTAECYQWEVGKKSELRCNNPGTGHHTATMHRYKSAELNGPWKEVDVDERHITPTIVCRDGLIEQVSFNW